VIDAEVKKMVGGPGCGALDAVYPTTWGTLRAGPASNSQSLLVQGEVGGGREDAAAGGPPLRAGTTLTPDAKPNASRGGQRGFECRPGRRHYHRRPGRWRWQFSPAAARVGPPR